jgi:hypothetical protein
MNTTSAGSQPQPLQAPPSGGLQLQWEPVGRFLSAACAAPPLPSELWEDIGSRLLSVSGTSGGDESASASPTTIGKPQIPHEALMLAATCQTLRTLVLPHLRKLRITPTDLERIVCAHTPPPPAVSSFEKKPWSRDLASSPDSYVLSEFGRRAHKCLNEGFVFVCLFFFVCFFLRFLSYECLFASLDPTHIA